MYKYDNRAVTFASESDRLPTKIPNDNVTLPKAQLQSFRDSYEQLLKFAAGLIGVGHKKMNTFDMLKFEHDLKMERENSAEMKAQLLDIMKHCGQYDWNNKLKAQVVDRFLPEHKHTLYPYQGGDRKPDAKD